MVRRASSKRAAGVAVLVALSGCGGGTASVKEPSHARPGDEGMSIGDTALANGGIPALGGGSNANVSGGEVGPGALRADLVDKDSPVKLDGTLQEWPARSPARAVIKGSADKLAFSVGVQYDAARLYVAGEVVDESFFRTERFGEGEDHASLLLAFPGGAGAYEIGLFAGKPGESAGEVRFGGARHGEVAGAKIVEAPTAKGYTFEAEIPWSTFPEARTLRVGLRGSVRYYDSDGSASARNIVATSAGDASSASSLPPLLTEPEQSMLEGLLVPKGVAGQAPKFDVYADVAGDGMKERISVFDRYFTICGPGYRGGKEYFFRDLGADALLVEARAMTGRAKDDIVLRRRFAAQGATRDWFEVWSLLGSDEPQTTFAHEITVVRGDKHVVNAVHVSVARREIELETQAAAGWDASSYVEPTAIDVEPILLPWGPTRTQTFRFDGAHFAKTKEVTQTPTIVPGQAPPPSLKPADVPTPPQQAGGDLSRRLFDQYKRDHGVAESVKPKTDLQVSVDGDARPERVILIGRDVVVFGPGFKGGTQYAFITLQQFADPADIKDLTARDLTGDGAADLIVRGVRHVSATGGGDPVDVDAMFIYQLKSENLSRVFAIETAREQAGKRVQGMVQFVPSRDGKTFEIDARPGRATGWTKKTYPWAQEQPGAGALEPLLLPWGGIASARYAWNGMQFAQ